MKLFDPARQKHPHANHLLFLPSGSPTSNEKTLPPISITFFEGKIYADILMQVGPNSFKLFTQEFEGVQQIAGLLARFIDDPEREILEGFHYDHTSYHTTKPTARRPSSALTIDALL